MIYAVSIQSLLTSHAPITYKDVAPVALRRLRRRGDKRLEAILGRASVRRWGCGRVCLGVDDLLRCNSGVGSLGERLLNLGLGEALALEELYALLQRRRLDLRHVRF